MVTKAIQAEKYKYMRVKSKLIVWLDLHIKDELLSMRKASSPALKQAMLQCAP